MRGPTWVILPTYNEAANLEPLARALLPVLERACPEGHRLLVVDDASPDGTGRIAARMARALPAVEVLHRPAKEGLGRAYVAGFARALAGGAGAVVEMDADFSHDPAELPQLLAAVRDGADVALGSRYVAGGRVSDWSAPRRLVSRAGCWYARRMLGLDVRDLTGGFKCFAAPALARLDFATVRSQGYAFQVELTYRAVRQGLKVVEVPIGFRERHAGKSKMSGRIALEAAWLVPLLRLRHAAPGPAAILSEATPPSPKEFPWPAS